MESKEIIEGNKLIAEFMGIRYHDNNTVSGHPSILSIIMGEDKIADFKFHTSWDWLMPVVEKMELIQYEPKDGDDSYNWNTPYLRTIAFNMVRINRQQLFQEETKIKSLWKAVVEFIKWYNTQKK